MSVAVILPAVGVGRGVASVVRDAAVAAYALRIRGMDLELLLAADRETEAAATKAAAEYGLAMTTMTASTMAQAHLRALRRVREQSRASMVATIDATGQHDATQLPRMIDMLERYDVVIGSRWARDSRTPGLTVGRWAMGRLANRAFRLATGIRGVTDATTAFRACRMAVLQRMDLDSFPDDARGIQLAFVANAMAHGFRVGEGPIIYQPPSGIVPRITGADVGSFLRYLLRLRTEVKAVRRHRLSPQGRAFSVHDFGAASDLERLGTADRFFDWTLDHFKPYLRGRLLEVGAGLGTITRKLVKADPALSVVALEPAGNLFGELHAYATVTPQVIASKLTSREYLKTDRDPFDAAIYLNVLEHIEDDVEELRTVAAALAPGGYLLIFGPALSWLYSELDYNAGHYRRYTVASLRQVALDAGLDVVSVKYLDVLGVLPYFLVYRLMRCQAISGSTMWGYDKVLVPLSRLVQWFVRRPPLGKNVIMVARRPLATDLPDVPEPDVIRPSPSRLSSVRRTGSPLRVYTGSTTIAAFSCWK
jgi:2-polyprenyl-3-methyl-5-hydroxy-6-metoxy-1,4-benzoquinol methylase